VAGRDIVEARERDVGTGLAARFAQGEKRADGDDVADPEDHRSRLDAVDEGPAHELDAALAGELSSVDPRRR
jgi:hypothetical protein